jgi:ABC-2 type transport system permease protein
MSTTTALGVAMADGVVLRRGPAAWLRGAADMMRFEWANIRPYAALVFVVQIMMGVGMAIMYGFFYPTIDATTALLITTGVPTLALVPMGFVLVPGNVASQRMVGTFDFIWSLPVPRSAQVAASFAVNAGLALPGTVLALLVGVWRYGVDLHLSPVLVPAVLLSTFMCVAVGYGMALLVANPLVVNLITNALVFLVLLFTPVVYPASNLPIWLMRIHEVLPFYPMAQVIRAGLTQGMVPDVGGPFLVIGVWALVGTGLTAWSVTRRH